MHFILISQHAESHVTVNAYHGTTISTLTSKILKKANDSSSWRYKMLHNGNKLEDHMTLLDNDIGDGETFVLKRMLKIVISIVKTPQEGMHYEYKLVVNDTEDKGIYGS